MTVLLEITSASHTYMVCMVANIGYVVKKVNVKKNGGKQEMRLLSGRGYPPAFTAGMIPIFTVEKLQRN